MPSLLPPYRVCHSTSSFARSLRAALCFSSSLSFSLLATSNKHIKRIGLLNKIETKMQKTQKRLQSSEILSKEEKAFAVHNLTEQGKSQATKN